ncbi:unnamed protein product [Gordionus sp. m RMFG-2023]
MNDEFNHFYKKIRDNYKNYEDKIIDLNNYHSDDQSIILLKLNSEISIPDEIGLNPYNFWKIHKFNSIPGLFFIKNIFTNIGQEYWMNSCLNCYPKSHKSNVQILDQKHKFSKLRWVTLGYHHNWDTKIYSHDDKSVMPVEIKSLCKIICECIGYEDFEAEAAIINYYSRNSFIRGHIDHSEYNLKAPLISISFGLSAIFMIQSSISNVIDYEHDSIIPLLIRNGDVLIMSDESRLALHAVPKILEESNSNKEEKNHLPYDNIRINMNVRQVF